MSDQSLEHQEPDAKSDSSGDGSEKPNANNRQTSPCLSPIITPPHFPPAPAGSNPTEKNCDWRKDVTLGIEFLGLAALIVYTVFSILQWQQIRWTNRLTREALNGSDKALNQTLVKMQKQVDAADTANEETHTLLAATQGAYIRAVVAIQQFGGVYGTVGISIANDGKTTATNFSGKSRFTRSDLRGKVIQSQSKTFPDTAIIPTGGQNMNFTIDNPPANYLDFRSEIVRVVVDVQFDDGFGNQKRMRLCREMVEIVGQGPGFVGCGDAKDWESMAERASGHHR